MAAPGRVRPRMPRPAPMSSTVTVTRTRIAGLSFVPKIATTISLEPGGAKSMTAAPTAATGDGAPVTNAATSSPAASATAAATTPESAASPRGTRPRLGCAPGTGARVAVAVVLMYG